MAAPQRGFTNEFAGTVMLDGDGCAIGVGCID